jgi:hypothetical protein
MNSKLVVALVAVAGPLGAQAIVRGAVTTEQGQRIAGVELQVPALRKTVHTDSIGEYRFILPPGNYKMTTRALGFFSESDSIAPELNVELIHDFTLTSIAKLLDTMTSTAERRRHISPGLNDFEERRRTSQGKYLTQEIFERYSTSLLGDVLRKLPGVDIRPGAFNAKYAASFRQRGGRGACYVSVYLDGVPLFTGLRGESPPDLNLFSPSTLAGAEFYSGGATSPVQFKDRTGCGMLLLWTRER